MDKTWITDLADFTGENESDTPQAQRIASFFGDIVAAGSLVPPRSKHKSPLCCRRRPKRRPCPGRLDIAHAENGSEIYWNCTHCNENGVIRGWQEGEWDMSEFMEDLLEEWDVPPLRVNVNDAQYKLLLVLTRYEVEIEIIVRSALRQRGGALLYGHPKRFALLPDLIQAALDIEKSPAKQKILKELQRIIHYELKAHAVESALMKSDYVAEGEPDDDADSSEQISDACPFCERLKIDDIIMQTELAAALEDIFPVSPGHTLIVPKRHESSYFSLSQKEVTAIFELVDLVKDILDSEFHPDGYNIGINEGAAAGQTVFHVHVHLIPRFKGDVDDPRGGIRWIKPDRAKYWER